jgi:hypothetical protein
MGGLGGSAEPELHLRLMLAGQGFGDEVDTVADRPERNWG